MVQDSKLRLSAVALCAVSATVMACAGEVEDPGYTHVIAPSEVVAFSADASLEEIQDVAVASSGEVWALQRNRAPHLFVFSAEGDLHDSFATTGGQRNQVSNPFTLLPTGDDQFPMAVWDAGNRRISVFNPYGRASVMEITRSRGQVYSEIENHSYGKPLDMARFGDGYLLMDHSDGLHVTVDYLRSELLRLNEGGELVDTLADFESMLSDSISALGRDVNYLSPIPLWATCPGGELAILDPFSRTLHWYGADGAESGTDVVPIPVRPLTEDDQTTFLRQRITLQWRETRPDEPDTAIVANSVEDFMMRHWDQFSPNGPPAVAMMCAGEREVWLQEFATADHPLGIGNRWLVHTSGSSDRVYVQFPDDFRPIRFVGRTVYGVMPVPEGVEVVAHVTVPDHIEAPAGEAGGH